MALIIVEPLAIDDAVFRITLGGLKRVNIFRENFILTFFNLEQGEKWTLFPFFEEFCEWLS